MEKEKFKKQGGEWLGAARSWLQWHCINGDRVTWGSNDVLIPHFTVEKIEDLAGDVAHAAIEKHSAVAVELIRRAIDLMPDGITKTEMEKFYNDNK